MVPEREAQSWEVKRELKLRRTTSTWRPMPPTPHCILGIVFGGTMIGRRQMV